MTRAAAYPFYSQWESPELVPSFLDGSLTAEQDPRWHRSGAASPAEYAYWVVKICGLACLKMILAARGEPVAPVPGTTESDTPGPDTTESDAAESDAVGSDAA